MKNFRKKTILFISLGLAIATIAFANSYEEPSKPGKPRVVDWDANHCDIEWTAPKYDGGSPIVSYTTEKRDKDSRTWVKCSGSTPGAETKRKVSDLEEGHTYEFRVIASNKALDSEPSDASAPIITKPR